MFFGISTIPNTSKTADSMSTENPDNAQLVDYDDVDDEIPTEPRIQGDENVDSLKFDIISVALFQLEDTMQE